jgi:hypothetical protein
MPSKSAYYKRLKPLMPLALLAVAQIAGGQGIPALLRLQRSTAAAEIEEHRQSLGNDVNAAASEGVPHDVWKYPNTASCLVVYNDGKYAFEKREERTLGHPKVKSAEGFLAADDLQQLKAILENEDLKKVTTPKAPDLPPDTQVVREIETIDAQIGHAGTVQRFTILKERVKTGALISATSGPSTGMDTYLDNGAPYKKTLNPLMKWFEELQKKNKSALKEAKPQYCVPMNIQ